MRGRLRTAWVQESGWKWVGRRSRCGGASLDARMDADGVGARAWVEMGGEKELLGMSELGCADGCGRRGCKGVGGNGRVEGAAGDERAWMSGRQRTAWVQESGWEWVGREAAGDERAWMRGRLRTAWVQGRGSKGKGAAGDERAWMRGRLRTAEWVEMGGEKEPLGMSELGCADGCGRRGFKGVGGNEWEEGAAATARAQGHGWRWLGGGEGPGEDERAWMRGRLRTVCARKGLDGNGWEKKSGGAERAWMLWTAWAQGNGWTWVGTRSRWGGLSFDARAAADGAGGRRRTWIERGEKNSVNEQAMMCGRLLTVLVQGKGMSKLGCAAAWLCGRLGPARAQGNGWKWVGG
eukprot:s2423_g17.t2